MCLIVKRLIQFCWQLEISKSWFLELRLSILVDIPSMHIGHCIFLSTELEDEGEVGTTVTTSSGTEIALQVLFSESLPLIYRYTLYKHFEFI